MSLFFPDVSHYQSGLSLKGASAVIAKATQGTKYHDPAYAGFRAQAATLGIPFAAYHWLDTADATAQARNAYAVVGPDVPLMIDDEQNVVNVGHTLAFVKAYRSLGGRVVLEYAPRWVWERSGKPDLRPLAAAGLALVSSNYPANGYTESGPGWAAYGGVTPTVWQYTSTRAFNGQRVDFNAYRGTVDDLRTLLLTPSTIGDDMTPEQAAELHDLHEMVKWNTSPWAGGALNAAQRIEAKVDTALTALGSIGSGNPDVAAILAGLDQRLAALKAEVRDAVADLGEGGAAQVRADS